jgi:hypothetical protein
MLPVALKLVALKSRLAAVSKNAKILSRPHKENSTLPSDEYRSFSNGRQQASVAPM